MKLIHKFLSVAALSAVSAVSAMATPISAGGGVTAAPVTITPTQLLASYNNVAFTSQVPSGAPAGTTSTFSGTYSAFVFKDSSNTLCAVAGSCLTFAVQVTNSANSRDGIESITTGPFSSDFSYNVGYAPGGDSSPINISDSIYGAMLFNFVTAGNSTQIIKPGTTSNYIVIQSSAMNYAYGTISFQDTQTATVNGFTAAAVAATPEPNSLFLLGTGLVGTATTLLRRRRMTA